MIWPPCWRPCPAEVQREHGAPTPQHPRCYGEFSNLAVLNTLLLCLLADGRDGVGARPWSRCGTAPAATALHPDSPVTPPDPLFAI